MKIEDLYKIFLQSTGICTDTRKLKKDHLFVALKGENFNGNKFAQQAKENGAIACIVDEYEFADSHNNIILVENGLKTLQKLASYHRDLLSIPLIGLTGSNGKTTTKELIASCLSKKYKVAFTQGNLNNHIGVPLTLLSITDTHEIAVIEMGANHLGEIEELCNIATPDYGYITNFGKAHLEGFGSLEGVVQGKSEMYDFLEKTNGKVFLNIDDPIQKEKAQQIESITFSFEREADYLFKRSSSKGMASVIYDGTELKSNLSGNYNEPNIAIAVTIALHFGVAITEIQKALYNYHPNLNRSQELEKGEQKILLDAYNANPSSMDVALRNFATLDGSKTVILGDMFELGKTSKQEHQGIAELVYNLKFQEAYLIGKEFKSTEPLSKSISTFETREAFINHLQTRSIITNRILIKGSRGMALEKLLQYL